MEPMICVAIGGHLTQPNGWREEGRDRKSFLQRRTAKLTIYGILCICICPLVGEWMNKMWYVYTKKDSESFIMNELNEIN